MEDSICPWESMERYNESCKKRTEAKRIGERMFPVLICSMIALPAIMVLVDQGPLWLLAVIPVGILVAILWLYAKKKYWEKQEMLFRNQVREDIIDAFHLDLSGRNEGNGPTAGISH